MKIPDLDIHRCNSCKQLLQDSDFQRFGAVINQPQMCFDYHCRRCGHLGRYVLDVKTPSGKPDPIYCLQMLISLLQSPDAKSVEPLKGNIRAQLNKIEGIDDLLRLGGDDAPREPTGSN